MTKKIESFHPLILTKIGAWRKWLSQNYNRKKYVWLLIQKKGANTKGVPYSASVEEAICYVWIEDAKRKETRKRRIQEVVKRSRLNIKPGITI